MATVHYTDFHQEGKLARPSAAELAKQAVQSVKKAERGKDGISYLISAMASGIITPQTQSNFEEILRLTHTASLPEALNSVQR